MCVLLFFLIKNNRKRMQKENPELLIKLKERKQKFPFKKLITIFLPFVDIGYVICGIFLILNNDFCYKILIDKVNEILNKPNENKR